MKLQLLPSTCEEPGSATRGQHFTCFVVNDRVAIDAGSLATGVSAFQRENIRDVVLTHAHLDHIAGLPLFIDDLFATLTEPVRIYAEQAVIDVLERDVFNWSVYPRFSELNNEHGPVVEYKTILAGSAFEAGGLSITPIKVNHKVPSSGFVISDGMGSLAMTGDTASLDGFWDVVNAVDNLSGLLIECAFPDELAELASISHHLTPSLLARELEKFEQDCPVYVVNLKPIYREKTAAQIASLGRTGVEVMAVGRVYDF